MADLLSLAPARIEKRLRAVTDWTVDLIFGRDISQSQMYSSTRARGVADESVPGHTREQVEISAS